MSLLCSSAGTLTLLVLGSIGLTSVVSATSLMEAWSLLLMVGSLFMVVGLLVLVFYWVSCIVLPIVLAPVPGHCQIFYCSDSELQAVD